MKAGRRPSLLLALALWLPLLPLVLLAAHRARRRAPRASWTERDSLALQRMDARTDAVRMTETDIAAIRAAGM